MTTPKRLRVFQPFREFLRTEQASGVILIICTAFSIILANSAAGEDYQAFWETHIGFHWGEFSIDHSLLHWINDGLMVVFFLVVGMEIKREIRSEEQTSELKSLMRISFAVFCLKKQKKKK